MFGNGLFQAKQLFPDAEKTAQKPCVDTTLKVNVIQIVMQFIDNFISDVKVCDNLHACLKNYKYIGYFFVLIYFISDLNCCFLGFLFFFVVCLFHSVHGSQTTHLARETAPSLKR